jgi:hypothetical protein
VNQRISKALARGILRTAAIHGPARAVKASKNLMKTIQKKTPG